MTELRQNNFFICKLYLIKKTKEWTKMKEKIKEFIVKNIKWIILFICLVGFLALAEDVFHKEIMNGDIIGYKLIYLQPYSFNNNVCVSAN